MNNEYTYKHCQKQCFLLEGDFEVEPNKSDIQNLVQARAEENTLSCVEAQKLAAELELSMNQIGKVANELGIKIVGCQLGCF